MQVVGPIVETYSDFAADAAGTSSCFEEWARGVAADQEVHDWLARLPEPKRQPNLVFAAARWHGLRAPAPYEALRAALLGDDGSIRATILQRATQTNEVGRLATLVPAFAAVADGRPVALLEVGASAGLCLYPDRWSYRWTTSAGDVRAGSAPRELTATVTGEAPLPSAPPQVVWRAGIDLHPLDVTDRDATRWLQTLVWPEHEDRRERLAQALDVARSDPPAIRRGDLLEHLPDQVSRARAAMPPGAVLVVFHSAVIAYLTPADRERFDALMRDLVRLPDVHWVSNEGPRVLPSVASGMPEPPARRFLLAIDGRAVGHAEGHGRSLHWLPAS